LKSGHLSSPIPTISIIISKIIHAAFISKNKNKNVSKEEFAFTNYEMQVANSELPVYFIPNAYFLPSYNGRIIWKISDL